MGEGWSANHNEPLGLGAGCAVFVVMLTGLYIAFFRHSGGGVLATTRVGGFGLALVGLSYFVGGFEGPAVERPLLSRVEAFSALTGVVVVLGALVWQVRSRS